MIGGREAHNTEQIVTHILYACAYNLYILSIYLQYKLNGVSNNALNVRSRGADGAKGAQNTNSVENKKVADSNKIIIF